MVNTSYRAVPTNALDLTANAARPRNGNGKSFRANALAAMADYTAARGSVASPNSTPAQNGTSSSQNVPSWAVPGPLMSVPRTAEPSSAAAPAVSGAVQSGPAQNAAAAPLTGDAATLKALQDALAAAGIDYGSFGLSTRQDNVTYPGGSYVNRYISVSVNGQDTQLMTDLVKINPKIAVGDIERMMGRPVVG